MSKYNTIATIKAECVSIAAKNGYKFDIPVEINKRLKTTLGRTHWEWVNNTIRPTKLDFNADYINRASDAEVLDTIRHEMAHYLLMLEKPAEDHGHDDAWKIWCFRTGAIPRAVTTWEQVDGTGYTPKRISAKYSIYCSGCGNLVATRTRKSKAILHPECFKSTCCKAAVVVKEL